MTISRRSLLGSIVAGLTGLLGLSQAKSKESLARESVWRWYEMNGESTETTYLKNPRFDALLSFYENYPLVRQSYLIDNKNVYLATFPEDLKLGDEFITVEGMNGTAFVNDLGLARCLRVVSLDPDGTKVTDYFGYDLWRIGTVIYPKEFLEQRALSVGKCPVYGEEVEEISSLYIWPFATDGTLPIATASDQAIPFQI